MAEPAASVRRAEARRADARKGDGRNGPRRPVRRDLAVVGASAGGVEALVALARNIPADIRLALLVVLHVPTSTTSRLAEVLDRAGPLRAEPAVNGELALPGRFYVAEPDRHMVVSGGRIFLIDGPRENGVRPAIDPLFRSAARTAGRRTIGVILSGTLDDGAAGMAAIQAQGGATVVQDPSDALSDGMPRAVLDTITPDAILPAARIGGALAELADGQSHGKGRAGAALASALSAADAEALIADPMTLRPNLAELVCPDCGGSLAEVKAGPMARFRCRVGHVYSPESLYGMKSGELEAGLWAALRTLEESASVARRLADRGRELGSTSMTRRFEQRQADAATRADLIRQALQSLTTPLDEAGERGASPQREPPGRPTGEPVPAAPAHDEGGHHPAGVIEAD